MPSSPSRSLPARLFIVLVAGLLAAALFSSSAQAETSSAPTGRVGGLVFDQLTRRLAGATVQLADRSGAVAGSAVTDARGHWSLSVPQGSYDVVVTGVEQGEALIAKVLEYGVGADSKLNLVVAGGPAEPARFSGRVVDGNNDPLAGVVISLSGSTQATATTGADGRFAIDTDAGRYRLVLTLPPPGGLTGAPTVHADLLLVADRDVTMRVPLVGVDVVVKDGRGQPVPGATASAGALGCGACPGRLELFPGAPVWTDGNTQGRTGPDGRVHLVAVDSGTIAVFAHSDATNWTRVDTTAAAARAHAITVNLPPVNAPTPTPPRTGPPVTLTGRLLDADGAPFTPEDTRVALSAPTGWGGSSGIEDDGSFSLTAAAGIWSLVVEIGFKDYECCDDRPPEHAVRFTVDNFVLDHDRQQDLQLPRMSFPVTVIDPTGAPVAGSWVRSQTADGPLPVLHDALFPGADATVWSFIDQPTDTSGVSETGLVPGALPGAFTVDPPGGHGLPATVTLAGGTTQAEVHLQDGPTLRGRFLGTGANHGSLVGTDGRQFPFTLNPDGTYAVTAPTGRYTILLDDWYRQEGESNDSSSWGITTDPFRLDGDRTLDLDYQIGTGSVWQVDSTGSFIDDLGNDAGGSLITQQPVAPGLAAWASFGVGGPGGYETFDLPLLGPSLATFSVGGEDTLAFTTGVYVAPSEDTIIAYAAGYGPPHQPDGQPGDPPTTSTTTSPPSSTTPPTTRPSDPATPPTTTSGTGDPVHAGNNRSTATGYWTLAADGDVYNFGEARALGNATAGAVDLEPTPTGSGYWILDRTGRVAAFGDAVSLGGVDPATLMKGEQPASLSATPTGKGYWVFTNRGRAIAFGDAPLLGDMSQTKLNGPVLGSVATPSGKGYYMVASDGGIFAFGDAAFAGSMGGRKLNAPVQSLVPDGDGHGYWLVASDGGIFAFDAPFRGSMGGIKLNKHISGMVRYGDGYLMVGADGGIFNFSSSPFAGSLGDKPPTSPVVAVAAMP